MKSVSVTSTLGLLLWVATMTMVGCTSGEQSSSTVNVTADDHNHEHGPSPEGAKLMLPAPPEASQTVIGAREVAKDGDELVITGRIGGSLEPWVEGRAAFQIVDASLTPCSEKTGDSCPTPWDYCCDTDRLPKSMALVKFVDGAGKTIDTDARSLFGVRELQTVVIKGRAQRDEAGNLTVLARELFAQPVTDESGSHGHAGHEHVAHPGHDHDHAHKHEPAETTKSVEPASTPAVPASGNDSP